MNFEQLHGLVLQALEHEKGGVSVYETAIDCAVNADLRDEWSKYLDQTRTHVRVLEGVCQVLGIDSEAESPGREVVRTIGTALVEAMRSAAEGGDPEAAQLVACEAVTLAETKDHLDWQLLCACAKAADGAAGKALQAACDQAEDEEDEHLYHTQGWCRELWLKSLGLRAVLPPPEEEHHVTTSIGASRAEQASRRARRRSAAPRHQRAAAPKAARNARPGKAARKTSGQRSKAKPASGKSGSRKPAGKRLAERKVGKVMREFKAGKLRSGGSGRKVTSRKQAIAIGLSEARAAGARIRKK